MNSLIKKILVSEKSFQSAGKSKFSFIVDRKITKENISKSVENIFSVNVLSVNSMNYKGKVKSVKRKKGVRNNFKKVILSLKPGQKINLFEIEGEEKENNNKKTKETKVDKKKEIKENKDVEVSIKSK